MSDLYTVSVKDRYASLCTERISASEKYGTLIWANEEATEELLPVKKEPIETYTRCFTSDQTREKTKKSADVDIENPTVQNREKLWASHDFV